jgi:hypothetical protein
MAMSQPVDASDLQFDRAEFSGQPADPTCAACQQRIADRYFDVNGQMTCSTCREAIANTLEKDPGWNAPLIALAAGLGGGVVGALLYYTVVALTGYEIGLIAIVVGLGVGRAVRWGSGGRGGRMYQVMAVAITYVAIVSTYVPFMIAAMRNAKVEQTASVEVTAAQVAIGVSVLFLVLLASPFLAGFQNIIGWLIIGFALWEAWKTNQRVPLAIAGPFALAPAAAAGGAAVPPIPTVPPVLPPPDLPPAPAAS